MVEVFLLLGDWSHGVCVDWCSSSCRGLWKQLWLSDAITLIRVWSWRAEKRLLSVQVQNFSLLLLLIFNFLCSKALSLIALHLKEDLFYCFLMWLCNTSVALGGGQFSLWSPLVLPQPLSILSGLLLFSPSQVREEEGGTTAAVPPVL